ncbi:arrestin domain-containing protein 3-like isoform X2 [Myxocyprinus asiaticus]|uniref:arrestin domain-containing protein 3-like isoform X2 n=1 Tax=Myxocyprinus asiaticus TaxID=70543 RepID=UPI002223C603|nr:arrestin domain-containing protein 3-like isoform X2 [Myxocyprinus asiaticus]
MLSGKRRDSLSQFGELFISANIPRLLFQRLLQKAGVKITTPDILQIHLQQYTISFRLHLLFQEMTIQSFTIEYDALNDRNTFSNGDILTGRVIMEVSKKTKIKSLTVKVKGKADVAWTETHGEESVTYWDKEKYFSQTQSVLPEDKADGSVTLVAGRHVFPFAFQLPYQGLPSSFKGANGKIHYRLLAKLSRSLHAASKSETKFTFVSRADYDQTTLMAPQHGSKDKNVIFFASGNISMNIFLPKTGYQQGEGLVVNGEIINNSTRKIVPKYIIYQKQSFFAGGITPTIQNCCILKVEYRLKVILDVSFTKNPMIKLPLIILPLNDRVSAKALEAGLPDLAKLNLN